MPKHARAWEFLANLADDHRVVVAEQTLEELYLLIRNPVVFPNPYSADHAVAICQAYRANPKWKLIECERIMEDVWKQVDKPGFPRRRIIDAGLALTLVRAGVEEFATHNRLAGSVKIRRSRTK